MADQDRAEGWLGPAKVWVGCQQHFHILGPVVYHISPASSGMIEQPTHGVIAAFMLLHYLRVHDAGDVVGQDCQERTRAGSLGQVNLDSLWVNCFDTIGFESSYIGK